MRKITKMNNNKEIKDISDITVFDRVTNPKKARALQDPSLIVTRTENKIYLKCLDHHRETLLRRKINFEMEFEEFKKGNIEKMNLNLELKEEMKPYDLDKFNEDIIKKYKLDELRRKTKKRQRLMMRIRKKLKGITNNGKKPLHQNNANANSILSTISLSTIGGNKNEKSGQGGNKNTSFSTVGDLDDSNSRMLSKGNKHDSDSENTQNLYLLTGTNLAEEKKSEIQKKSKSQPPRYKKNDLLRLSIKERKRIYTKKTTIPTELNNQQLKNQSLYLTNNLRASNKKALMSKLGYFITDVDHSDIVIGGKLWLMGKSYLSSLSKDVDALRARSTMDDRIKRRVMKNSHSVKSRKLGEIELLKNETKIGNSEYIRRNFFKNIYEGNM